MKLKIFVPFLIVTAFVLTACEDFLEQELESSQVNILAPPDNYQVSSSQSISFWWDEVEGASQYNFQIVSPSFNNIEQLIVDTNVATDRLFLGLAAGTYEWRVRAENSISETDYVTRSLTVLQDTTNDLSNKTLILTSPSDNHLTNKKQVSFKWVALQNADQYTVQISDSANNIIQQQVVTEAQYEYQFQNDGQYIWGVRGESLGSGTVTPYSRRTITIDTEAPPAPQLVDPANGDTVALPATLVWTHDASATGDSIYIYKADASTLIIGYPRQATGTSHSFNTTVSDTVFWWKVRSFDAAGNLSGFSQLFKFVKQ